MIKLWSFMFLLVILQFSTFECSILNITYLNVPTEHIVERDPVRGTIQPLILDCDYEINPNQDIAKFFVLKWLLNGNQIYQWIPYPEGFKASSDMGHSSGAMKNLIDTTYVNPRSKSPYKRYSSLYIKEPTWNMTGNYSCDVSFLVQSSRRTKHLTVIIPEQKFELKVDINKKYIHLKCTVENIYPLPELSIRDGKDRDVSTITDKKQNKGTFNVTVYGRMPYTQPEEEMMPIMCFLSISNTSYIKNREINELVSADNYGERIKMSTILVFSSITMSLIAFVGSHITIQ